MRTSLSLLSLPVFFSMIGTAGCGGARDVQEDAPAAADSGAPLGAGPSLADSGAGSAPSLADAGVGDAPSLVDAGPSPEDAGDAAPSTVADAGVDSLVTGSGLHVLELTSDGYVIYWGPSSAGATTNSVFAVPLAGGAPIVAAGPYGGHFIVNVLGPDVFVWDLGSDAATVGPLGVWSHANGFVSLSSASVEGNAAVNDDGSRVAFVTNTTATQKDLAVAGSDGSNSTILVSGIYRDACPLDVAFAGGGVLTQFCSDPLPDGGVNGSLPPTLAFFPTLAPASRTDLLTLRPDPDHYDWSLDSAGTRLYAPSAAGVASAISLPSAASVTLDSTGGAGGLLSADGGTAFYLTTSGQIRRSSTAAPVPATVVPSGASGLVDLSPDLGTVAYYATGNLDANGIFVSDLYVASTGAAAAPTALVTSASLLFEAFTSNSAYLAYAVTTSSDDLTGTLQAAAVDGGATIALGTNVFEERMGLGAKVVFADNYAAATGAADIHAVDLATGTAPTLVAAAVTNFRLTSDQARIVYATSTAPAGLYVVAVP